ncbi:putative carbohydrate esterase [Platanthera zijinensis]|uniref:Carbohydrate esterase n=1 Tax=Platanthera zijinensis TaxID=2320716 RepID=A0AAP0BMX1_9ASPA
MLLSAASSVGAAAAAPNSDIFILAGQSNMGGRGGVNGSRWDHFIPRECRPSPSILRLSAGLRWEVAREPLHADIDAVKICGVGPGMPFAHAVLTDGAAARRPIGLVPCAVGGTKISEWAWGTHLYSNLVRRALVAADGGGRLAAMLWYQGESDTVLEADARAYGGRMKRLVSDLRRDLQDPNLIVIQVRGS